MKKAISLSIPESVTPRVYDRVRRIVTAEYLAGVSVRIVDNGSGILGQPQRGFTI